MIVGFVCEHSEERVNFADCLACAEQVDHLCDFTPEILKGIFNGLRIPKENYTVTNLLSCPRKINLMRNWDYYIRPSNAYWAYRGQLAHKIAEEATGDGVMVEKELRMTIRIDGEDINISGIPDYFNPASGLLRDYKTCEKVPKYNKPYAEHSAQTNIYACLLRANGYTVNAAEIVYLSMKEPKRVPVKLVEEEACRKMIEVRLKVLLDPNLPPKLEPESKGIWECTGYCDVKHICEKLALNELTVGIRKEIRKEMEEERR